MQVIHEVLACLSVGTSARELEQKGAIVASYLPDEICEISQLGETASDKCVVFTFVYCSSVHTEPLGFINVSST